MKKIRIKWQMEGHEGHGKWYDDTDENRKALTERCLLETKTWRENGILIIHYIDESL